MNDIIKEVPLWSITTWDKKFNGVEREWQPKTIKYKYLLSDELDQLKVDGGNIRLLYTGKDVGFTTEELAGDCISEGEIVSIPWGGIPTVKYHRGKFVTGDNRIMTSNNPNEVSNKYLYYFMKGHIKEIASYYRGASLKHPSMRDVLKMVVSYPNIDRQESIIKQLDLIEGIIDIRQKELLLFDDLIKARFVEMFGDMLLNPMEWSEVKLETVADIVSGITKGRKIKEQNLFEVPYMAVSNVKDGYIDWTTIKTIMATKQEIDQYCLEPNDVLMTEGGDPDKLGRGAIIKSPLENSIHQNHIFRVRLESDQLLPVFFAEYLQHPKAKRYFLSCAKQTTGIASINMKQLRVLPVLVPPLKLQNQFADFVAQVDKSKFEVQKALEETQILMDSLMQEYFG